MLLSHLLPAYSSPLPVPSSPFSTSAREDIFLIGICPHTSPFIPPKYTIYNTMYNI